MKFLKLFCLLLLLPFAAGAQDIFELAPPLIRASSVFFDKWVKAEIKFGQPGATVHYTIDGTEPTEKSSPYKGPVLIRKNLAVLKAKAFGDGFTPSTTVSAVFIKSGLPIKNAVFTLPDSRYPGDGANALTDSRGGDNLLSANTWVGYYCDTVNVLLTLEKKQPVKSILINFLQNESSWVFLPEKITVEYLNDKTKDFDLVTEEIISAENGTPGSNCVYRLLQLPGKIMTDKLKIHLFVLKLIPTWHDAKGSHAWMFMDEIKVY